MSRKLKKPPSTKLFICPDGSVSSTQPTDAAKRALERIHKTGLGIKPKPIFTLMTAIKRKMSEEYAESGKIAVDVVADAFVDQMAKGSFAHQKEWLDREEGKVPTRIANSDGSNIKMYIGMPVDDDDGAP